MDYLRLFNTQANYNSNLNSLEFPTVSYVEEIDRYLYMKEPDYSQHYLTFKALESGTFTLSIPSSVNTSYVTLVSYSLDGGQTWTTTVNSDSNVTITTPTVTAGNKVLWRGAGKQMASGSGSSAASYFSSTCNFEVSGNIMSLLYDRDFIDKTTFIGESNYIFSCLFKDATKLKQSENLLLPATTLAQYCYSQMFSGCTSLITPPELPATTLQYNCYGAMFSGCTSLTTAPELPATTLAANCYNTMFYGCTSLTTAPVLPATTLANKCYNSMFNGCTSLNYIKAMFVTTPTTSYTQAWVSGVASTGTFIKSPMATWDVTGTYGVPTGWTTNVANVEWPRNYNYFATEAIENAQFTLTIPVNVNTSYVNSVSYSLDNGQTWTTTNNSSSAVTITTPTVNAGKKVLWRGVANQYSYSNSTSNSSIFSSTGRYNVSGDILSLIGCNISISETSTFAYLFYNSTNLISASNLLLSSTELKHKCYQAMFQNCTSLTTAPALPATTLANYCYTSMFNGCTSLTTAPVLPATTMLSYCYQEMFYGCTSLTTVPNLPATTLANYCYQYMFSGCTNLTTIPSNMLPATTLQKYCYSYMFQGCTALITVPTNMLPSKTLADYCYQYMFKNCTGLTTAPELPAPTLAVYCYAYMFQGCSALTAAPVLPATTIMTGAYNYMFQNCSNLNYIKALFTTTPTSSTASNWVYGVAATGTFVKHFAATWDVSGVNGVPNGWNAENAQWSNNYFTTEAIDDCVFSLRIGSSVTTSYVSYVEYSTDNGSTWNKTDNTSSTVTITTPTITAGNSVKWRCAATALATSSSYAYGPTSNYNTNFSSTGRYNISGDISTLLYPDVPLLQCSNCNLFGNSTSLISAQNLILHSSVNTYCYAKMFSGCTSLTTAPALPATTLATQCYYNMFSGCTSLTTAPALPATTLTNSCYYEMFNGCASLTTAPALPATTLADQCCRSMFKDCTSLTTAPALPATTLAQYCYSGMFQGCTSLTTIPSNMLPATTLQNYCYWYMFDGCTSLTTVPSNMLPATTLRSSCYRSMFNGCTSLTTAPELPATTLASDCYDSMFNGCSSLNYIKAMFITTPVEAYVQGWVRNVAATGTFVKNNAADWDITASLSNNYIGVPSGWTVQTASE